MESVNKIAELRFRFIILSNAGFDIPDEDKLFAMTFEELEKQYSEIIAKIQKDSDIQRKEAITECYVRNLIALAKVEK